LKRKISAKAAEEAKVEHLL